MRRNNTSGFTLTEIMTVVLVIGILLALAVPSFGTYRKKTQANACRVNMRSIVAAVEEARMERDAKLSEETESWSDDAEFEVTADCFLVSHGYLPNAPVCPTDKSHYKVIMTNVGTDGYNGYKVEVKCTARNVEGHDISNDRL